MYLFNSLTKQKEQFLPIDPPNVGLYTCGQTVYDFTHIGHGRKYVNDDILRRALTYLGYKVTHVQNVTDVGHLVSDADEGEDKLEKGARKYGKSVWEVADFYTKHFYNSLDKLNVLRPNIICKATEHITEQIWLVKKLIEKGHAYETSSGIFFSIDSFPEYGQIFGQNLGDKKIGVREEVVIDNEKKNPADFALWFKTVGRFKDHVMHWDSPWGEGFPGWHVECSAMSMKYLGETFDIHTGGIDHIPVHHPNEIAQSEAATGKKFVNYWLHTAFLTVDGKKMSKSLDNFYKVEDIENKHINPLSLRYLYLLTHYRKELNFTWEALSAADSALVKLRNHIKSFKNNKERLELSEEKLSKINDYRNQFKKAIEDDLNTPEAISTAWTVVKSNIPSEDKYDLLLEFDNILGLNISFSEEQNIPDEIINLANARKEAKAVKDYEKSDKLREEILQKGYEIEDRGEGYQIKKINS
ncbi:MAG TPA: cysteine--tRNA ligase [Candidatus Nitrosocosmicus sp.]|nr:cysteine--tRNA ligase [Candidatus Nitrosocosmicus sp.]